jgi:hypothetical protein
VAFSQLRVAVDAHHGEAVELEEPFSLIAFSKEEVLAGIAPRLQVVWIV